MPDPVRQYQTGDSRWPDYVAHLQRCNDARWVLDDQQEALPDVYYLGIEDDGDVIANITIKVQPLAIPETEWSAALDEDHGLTGPDGSPLRESFVQTFTVEEAYRRRGYGTALQQAALALCKELDCYQMRSWSSLDSRENYALKLKMGFAVFPAIYETGSGLKVSGAYFVKRT